MKKIVTYLTVILFVFFLLSFVNAAPSIFGMALNHETKECGNFWEGDEFVHYELPEGWEDYYESSSGLTKTEVGDCNWSVLHSEEDCCKKLGYKYVSGNIGVEKWRGEPGTPFLDQLIGLFFIIIVIGIIAYLYSFIKKK